MVKAIKTLLIVFLIGCGFFISYYTSSHNITDIPKQFSSAQETILNLINTLTTKSEKDDTSSLVNVTPRNTIIPLGENIFIQYEGEKENYKNLSFSLRNSNNEPVQIKETLKDDKTIQIEVSKKISPGKHTLLIMLGQKELLNAGIYLGTIALNSQQFQYSIGENYISDIAMLDDNGKFICINNPNFMMVNTLSGVSDALSIKENKCSEASPSAYRLVYTPKTTGTYVLQNATDPINTMLISSSAFNVIDVTQKIVVKRDGPLFVAPGKEYEVKISIEASENFEGTVTDFIPSNFIFKNSNNYSLQSVVFDGLSLHLRNPFNGDFPVTLKFGAIPDDSAIYNDYKTFGVTAHDGIDFALPDNTPVLAVDDGKVIDFPSKLSSYGINVVLEHPWGGRTFYGHLSKVNVEVGQKIGKGQVIGFSGHTGLVTGPHLHFGLDFKNSDVNNGFLGKIDPTQYLSSKDDLNVSTQKLIWNISVGKGEKKELGYVFKIPEDDYGYHYFELGPINIVNKADEVMFKDGQKWTLIKN